MIKNGNVRIAITLTEKELSLLEDASMETGLSKSTIVKIALMEKLEKLEKLQNIFK